MTRRAPIACFVYKRPLHARRMLESLLRNPEAAESPIHIFCDGPRGNADLGDVAQTRKVVAELAPPHARLVERESNLGLAASVITGVSALTGEYGEAIVLEDDLVISPVALDYFNRALERYRTEDRVMHVSGYMYPVHAELPETFFYREATCWGWATWGRAWARFEPDAARIRDAVLARGQHHAFDAGGSFGFFGMLEKQVRGEVDSWAIRWYGSMWLHGGLALHPARSLVRNIGHDGTGEHSNVTDVYDVEPHAARVGAFAEAVVESEAAVRAIMEFRARMARGGVGGVLGRIWRALTR